MLFPGVTSRPREFHLRALPEPCMTLSSHTAPDVRPLLAWLAHGLLLFPVGQWPRPNPFATASLQGLRCSYGLLRPCAPLRYSRPRGWSRLRLVPSHGWRDEAQVLTFIRKPGRASRRLYAGCRSGSIRASPELIPEEGSPPVLTSPNPLSTLLQRFACARLSRPCLPKSCPGVSATLTTTAFARSSLRWLEIGS